MQGHKTNDLISTEKLISTASQASTSGGCFEGPGFVSSASESKSNSKRNASESSLPHHERNICSGPYIYRCVLNL